MNKFAKSVCKLLKILICVQRFRDALPVKIFEYMSVGIHQTSPFARDCAGNQFSLCGPDGFHCHCKGD
jgi:hypothetical protein